MKLTSQAVLFGVLVSLFVFDPAAAQSRPADTDVPYGVADWPEAMGNHRAKLHVEAKADAVWGHLPWRRRDAEPDKKQIIVIDAADNQPVKNLLRVNVTNEAGDILFQPATAPGDYYVYYMPFKLDPPEYCPTTVYLAPTDTADAAWKTACAPLAKRITSGDTKDIPAARLVEFQSINEFHRFDPMELPATAAEMKTLLDAQAGKTYLVFPEDRKYPIRMNDALPLRWIRKGPSDTFTGEACRGEYYVFQLGIYAVTQNVVDLQCPSETLVDEAMAETLGELTCFNTEGSDWLGREIGKKVNIARGHVQALWFGVQVPPDAKPGDYETTILLDPPSVPSNDDEKSAEPEKEPPSTIHVKITVKDELIKNSGDDDLWRHSRLRWLNSKIGINDDLVAQYTPVEVDGRTARVLGRSLTLADSGLPEQITTTFSRSVDRADAPPVGILAGPIRFIVETAEGPQTFSSGLFEITRKNAGQVTWRSISSIKPLALLCEARLECDGHINYKLTLHGPSTPQLVEAKDIRLEIPIRREVAVYWMGLGRNGGYRPQSLDWKWDDRYANNYFWIGDVHAGLAGKLKHVEDRLDLYSLKATGPYADWGTGKAGGCRLREEGSDTVVLTAFTGPRELRPNAPLHFNFSLMITPFHAIDPDHWHVRYMHPYPWTPLPSVDQVQATGANVAIIHQGPNVLNPHINYPFIANQPLKQYIDTAHSKGLKVKLYYTIRELSNYAAEIWALRSLGDEVYLNGPGFHLADTIDDKKAAAKADAPPPEPAKPKTLAGHPWLVEHLIRDYVPAWHQPLGNAYCDAAIATQGLSRWHNYYLEGLNWLIRVQGVDGLYLDGAGFDREIIKRMRKVMDAAKPGCLIDFHEGHGPEADYGVYNPLCLHMELMPYLNSLWFGEMFNYNAPPEYWLVEMAGIPFGLPGEMLQDGGNKWRGMLYGMTQRLPWSGDPRPVWKVWDDFGIDESRMIGYWDEACPVKTQRKDILATAYVRDDRTLVSVASWAPNKETVKLTIDWAALKLDPAKMKIVAPEVKDFQPAAEFAPDAEIPVEPGRGWLLVLRNM